ncbi:MAG: pyridoxal-phosphate dependent enzyme [Anaerolineae bacterium]|nr:pyridoxal-phosphate dependent enzyme [Anaerolineae bacterium]
MTSLFSGVRCLACDHVMAPDPYLDTCAACGSPWLHAEYDTQALPADWLDLLKDRESSLWRYEELYPFPDGFFRVTMGEGWTPLVRAAGLERENGHTGIWIKDERQHATGSFKDRQAATAVSALRARGIDNVVLASTGNAAAAYAAYCARAGIKLWAFVTSSVPAEKMRELALYDAEVIKVSGTYDQAKTVAANFAERHGYLLDKGAKAIPCKESMKTVAFEIAEQMTLQRRRAASTESAMASEAWEAPDWYVQAVSGGIGPLGVLKGFEELAASGLITHVPKIAVVQTEGCSPMVRAWQRGLDEAIAVEQPDSLITVLATGSPGLAYTMLKKAADRYGGAMVAVSDGEAFRAMRRVARAEGLSMEPAASVAFAGLDKLLEHGYIEPGERVVVNCSGHTFSAEKYALEDRYILNLSVKTKQAVRPAEGLATTLEELDERITTVVIIDDNPYDSRLIRRFLKNYRQYRVFEASSSKDGLDLVRQRQPDVVLLDLMMPEMDGFAVMDALKADPRTAHIPVVIVSAKSLLFEERERLEAYAESVWQKGRFSARDLVSHVVELVEQEQAFSLDGTEDGTAAVVDFGRGREERILVVDDYEPEARLIRRLLETRPSCRVFEAHSGAEALALIEQVPLDLIILDLFLPDIAGDKLLVMLRTRERTQKTPVIVVTSHDDLDAQTRAQLSSNVDSIWSKSVLDRSSFLSHVDAILTR